MTSKNKQLFFVSRPYQVAMLLINAVPLMHLAALAWILLWPINPLWVKLVWFSAILYVLPPVMCRWLLLFFPVKGTHIPIGTGAYLVWWLTANLQTIFVRLPFLDECLRFVPGLYSQWVRLWGGKVGRLTYWAPGMQILDRTFVDIGDHVVFGAGSRIAPHVIVNTKEKGMVLLLANVSVGDNCVIGGYSVLSAGTRIAEHECTRAFLISPPFSIWSNGKRVRPEGGGSSAGWKKSEQQQS